MKMNFIKKYFERRKEHKFLIENIKKQKIVDELENAKMQVIMDSDIPWVKRITTESYDINNPPKNTIRERYKWNKAFISSLKQDGYSGEEEEIVLKWEINEEKKKIESYNSKLREERMNSDDPWIEVLGDEYDEETQQVNVKLDWNKAFVKVLRTNGYSGSNDESIINRYLKSLSESLAAEISSEKYDV